MGNWLWKSGASILHGHAQMSLTHDLHYPKVEHLRRSALVYCWQQGQDYFDDLYQVHQALGLAFPYGDTRVLAHLTRVKEKEVLLIADDLSKDLESAIYRVLHLH